MFAEPFITLSRSIDLFMLILSRMIGLFFIAPMMGRNSIPALLKLSICILLSYILLPFQLQLVELKPEVQMLELVVLLMREITIGLGLGFVAQVFFGIFLTAGAILDLEVGFSMVRLYDPQSGSQISISSKLIESFAYLIFFAVNGHHFLIRVLMNSYMVLPIRSEIMIGNNYLDFLIRLTAYMFVSAITLVIPITISIFMGNLLLAFMAKIMPQMNVFIVGMPMKIFLGLAVFFVSIPFMTQLIRKILFKMFEYMYLFNNIIKG